MWARGERGTSTFDELRSGGGFQVISCGRKKKEEKRSNECKKEFHSRLEKGKKTCRKYISTSFLSFFSRHFERREGEEKAASFRKIFILFSLHLRSFEHALQEKREARDFGQEIRGE